MIHPELVVAGILGFGLIIYALLGGADFGGGIWDLLAFGERARQHRALIINAMAPVWEANHVWLILVVVLLFTGFPPAFAAITTALHIPLTLALIAIVLRGSAFAFRQYGTQDDKTVYIWSKVFGISSLLAPLFLGMSLGALSGGEIKMVNGTPANGFFAGWLTPFAIGCGIFAQSMFAFLAAIYLTNEAKSDPELQADYRSRGLFSGVLLAVIAMVVLYLSKTGAPVFYTRMIHQWGPWILAVTGVCEVVTFWGLKERRFAIARIAAAGVVVLVLSGWGIAQYPYLVTPGYTITSSAAPPITLRYLLIGLGSGAFILVPSMGYLFKVFKFRRD